MYGLKYAYGIAVLEVEHPKRSDTGRQATLRHDVYDDARALCLCALDRSAQCWQQACCVLVAAVTSPRKERDSRRASAWLACPCACCMMEGVVDSGQRAVHCPLTMPCTQYIVCCIRVDCTVTLGFHTVEILYFWNSYILSCHTHTLMYSTWCN